MKQAMERYLPHDILYRPKMGFVTPVSAWFRGPLVDQARALATSSTLARSGWFDMAEIERIVAAHQSGRRDHGRLIWQYFMLEKSLARLFGIRSEEHTSELQSLMRTSYAVFCLKKKK